MERSRIDAAGLLCAVAAAVLVLLVAHLDFGLVTTAAGLTLLFVLFAYDREGRRSVFQSLAFSAVCGFCLMLVSGAIFQFSLIESNADLSGAARESYFQLRLSAVWAFATILLLFIDRSRMSGRTVYEAPAIVESGPKKRQLVPEFTGSFPAVERPQQAAPTPPPPAQPAPAVRTAPPAPEYREPVVFPITATTFSVPREPARPAPVAPAPPPPEPVAPPATLPPPAPAPVPVHVPAGKETMIYVNLVGEGLNVLRSVRAEHLGRDFYKIVEDTPEGETWQYSAGQVVRCKKQKLSSGKALVAFEEAPRS